MMQKSGKVSEKSQQLTWSLKVLPNIHSAPLNPTLPSVIWARTRPTLGILRLSAPTILPTGSTPNGSPSSSRVLELHWPRPLGPTRVLKARTPLWFTLGKQRVSFCSASGKNMSAELTGVCFLINKSKVSSVHQNLLVSSCLLTRGACSVNSFSLDSLRPYGL